MLINSKKNPNYVRISSKNSEVPEFAPFNFDMEEEQTFPSSKHDFSISPATAVSIITLFAPLQEAYAKGGEYGIFEGRIASMAHPFTMFALLATSVYSGSLGLQWRSVRTIAAEIKDLTAQLPKLSTGLAKYPIADSVAALQQSISTAPDGSNVATLENDLKLLSSSSVKEIDMKIQDLSMKRKELLGKNLKDKHHLTGSVLLGVGVMVSILGGFNTYLRAGKLFPGPHLFAGMGITGLWAAAAALTPAMQKGNDAARSAHIALNTINVCLFFWQVVTGIPIMLKVIEFTKFP
jgi:hypothetical protein